MNRGGRASGKKRLPASVKLPESVEERAAEERRRNREAERGLVAALQRSGVPVGSVTEIPQLGRPAPEAIPELIAGFGAIQNSAVRSAIVSALSAQWARPAARFLVSAFLSVDDSLEPGLRWKIGSALAAVASEEIGAELRQLAGDRSYGKDREMIVLALAKTEPGHAVRALIELLSDETVAGHAVRALGQLRAIEARDRIEALADHPKAWVRSEVKRALKRLAH